MNIKIHGDIILRPTKQENGEIINHKGSYVLAEGETTGHKHVITVPKIDDMVVTRLSGGRVMLTLKAEGTVTHEEHKTLTIPVGDYVIEHEREFDYFGLMTRKVID